MKQLGAVSGVAVLGSAAYADISQQEFDDGDLAAVRVGHLSPNAPAVDVYLNRPVGSPTLEDLEFPGFKPDPNDAYLTVPSGEYDVTVTEANTVEDPVLEEDGLELDEGARYTLLAAGDAEATGGGPSDTPPGQDDDGPGQGDGGDGENATDGEDMDGENATDGEDEDTSASFQQDDQTGQQDELQLITLTDAEDGESIEPADDEVEVRFVHASPGAGPVNISVGGEDGTGGTGGNQTDGNESDGEDENGDSPLAEAAQAGDQSVEVGPVDFGEASDYETLDPGQVTITVSAQQQEDTTEDTTDDGLGGNESDDGMGGNETDDGLGGNETDDGMGGNETDDGMGGNESDDGMGGNETDENTSASFQQDDDDTQTGQTDGEILSVSPELYGGTRITAYVTGMPSDQAGGMGGGMDDGEDGMDGEDENTSASQQGQSDDQGQGQDLGQEPMLVVSLDSTSPQPEDVLIR